MTLVLGSNGQLGTAFRRLIPSARFLTREDADLARRGEISRLLAEIAPKTIINCAAFTAVDRAEDEEDLATAVNAVAVGDMAAYAAANEIPFVTFSTDYVFDGLAQRPYTETGLPNPISAYGRSKLAGEERAFRNYPGALVIRTSWVISGTHSNFVSAILKKARTGHVSVVDDQTGCPTFVDDLASATTEALANDLTGILHITNNGATTWYDLARQSVEIAGMNPQIVRPCRTEDLNLRAQRPRYSALSSDRATNAGISALPRWQERLPVVVEQILSHM